MVGEVGDALQGIASRSPLVIVFEDLQWVDYSTVDLISVLARRRTAARLMLVGTYRDDEVALSEHPLGALKQDLRSRHLCHEIALGRLSEAQVVDYLVAEQPRIAVAGRTGCARLPALRRQPPVHGRHP